MTIQEIRDLKTEELYAELDRLRRHVFDLRSQAVTEKLQNPHLLTQARRDIARLFTVLRERNETDVEQKQYHMEALATHMMKKEMERIDMPDVHEFLDILKASGVKLWACKLAMDMFHYKLEDMYADIDGVLTVGDFYKQGRGVGTHMLFI